MVEVQNDGLGKRSYESLPSKKLCLVCRGRRESIRKSRFEIDVTRCTFLSRINITVTICDKHMSIERES